MSLSLAVDALRRAVGCAASRLVVSALMLSDRRAGMAVVYHRIGDPQGDCDRELVPALGTRLFAAQLRHLSHVYAIVEADRLHAAVCGRRRWMRFPVAITFDDDLDSHARAALGELGQAGIDATFFLCGASLDRPFAFWWERLQRVADEEPDALASVLPERATASRGLDIHTVALTIEKMCPPDRDELAEALGRRAGPDPPEAGIREDAVRALVEAGHSIGFHTRRHDRLSSLGDEALRQALRDGAERLAAIAGRPLRSISYPHGRADERVAKAAREAGFATGFTTTPKVITPQTDPLLMGRIPASFASPGHFATQLARTLLQAFMAGASSRRADRVPMSVEA